MANKEIVWYSLSKSFTKEYVEEHGGGRAILVGTVTNGTTAFPTKRKDSSDLVLGDFVKPADDSTFPCTVKNITFRNMNDQAVYAGGTNWLYNANPFQDTSETPLSDASQESISGTAVYQNEVNAEIKEELDKKVDKIAGKGLSANDYTTEEKNKLANIEASATKVKVDAGEYQDTATAHYITWTNQRYDIPQGTYSKPAAGIPKVDLTSDIQVSLGLADTALQEHQSLADYATKTELITEATSRSNADTALDTRIDNLQARGRFLSLWDCTLGLPETEPSETPYAYKTGDYFIISKIDAETNYRPSGSSYTGDPSTAVETAEIAINDSYLYDGTVWQLLKNTASEVSFSNIAGQPTDNTNLAAALNAKYSKPAGGIPDGDIASATTWNEKQNAITSDTDLAINSLTTDRIANKTNEHTFVELINDEWYLGDSTVPINATDAQAFYVPQVDSSGANDQAATKQYVDERVVSELFWCTYGTTTYSQMAQAVTDGKMLCCKYSPLLYTGCDYVSGTTTIRLYAVDPSGNIRWIQCDSNGTWSNAAANNVHLTGNQTISGVKTFSTSPIVPTPTADTEATNKSYVDEQIEIKVVKQTATVAVADWSNGVATCSITGLELDSSTTQKAECCFTDNAIMRSAKPWFSCSTAGTLTITCQGSVPTAAVTVVVVMTVI